MKSVSYSRDAVKSLRRHKGDAGRIQKVIDEYAAETGAHANSVTRLVGSKASRLRVGDFRVIFEESESTIAVTKIGPRGSIYD